MKKCISRDLEQFQVYDINFLLSLLNYRQEKYGTLFYELMYFANPTLSNVFQ